MVYLIYARNIKYIGLDLVNIDCSRGYDYDFDYRGYGILETNYS